MPLTERTFTVAAAEPRRRLDREWAHAGATGSGDLEVLLEQKPLEGRVAVHLQTPLPRMAAVWERLVADWVQETGLADVAVTIHEHGATPATGWQRLHEALAAGTPAAAGSPAPAGPSPSPAAATVPDPDAGWQALQQASFLEAGARDRALGILDPGTYRELLPPHRHFASPHLPQMGFPIQFDDGLVTAVGRLGRRLLFFLSLDGRFIGGSLGEVNGAKMAGVLRLARREYDRFHAGTPYPLDGPAVAIVFETGGVRLQEANAGLLANAEVMNALHDLRGRVPTVALIGGKVGAFGGLGFVAAATDVIIMSQFGRMGLTGPEVVEQEMGREEFDASDRALVWRTTGGRHRYLLRDANYLVQDRIGAFREQLQQVLALDAAGLEAMRRIGSRPLIEEQLRLVQAAVAAGVRDSRDLWQLFGNPDPDRLPDLPLAAFLAGARRRRTEEV